MLQSKPKSTDHLGTMRKKAAAKEVFFLGLMYSDDGLDEAKKYSKAGLQMAPQIFQQNLLKGLEDREDVSLSVIHVPLIGSYPIHYNKLLIKDKRWRPGYHQLGYINLPLMKHKVQEIKIKRELGHMIDNSGEQYVFIYTMYPPFVKAANKLKKKYPSLHVSLLQTDPILGKDGIYTKNTSHNIRKGHKLIGLMKNFDSFVVLTKYIAEAMDADDRPYAVIDCIIDESSRKTAAGHKPAGRKRFLYTGSTRSTNGIITLAEAFDYLPDAELWICGDGDSDDYIREKEKNSDNIKFYGKVDHSKIADIQAQCDFMINPRTPTGGFTKYSFPSKTAEYMMTGLPTVMYRLEGLSEEYDDLLNYLYSETPEGLAEELNRLIEQDYDMLLDKAARAREYMLREKNPEAQVERIITMWDETKCPRTVRKRKLY